MGTVDSPFLMQAGLLHQPAERDSRRYNDDNNPGLCSAEHCALHSRGWKKGAIR